MNQNYTVSIIMPTYNREKIIYRAIDSVLNQTYSNYKLIICDDGSTDNTKELISEKYDKYINKKIIYLEQDHSGVSKARNTGLNYAKGDLVAYLDSDNFWDNDYLEKMVRIFDNPENNTAYCAIEVHDSKRKTFVRNKEYNRKKILKRNFIDLNIFIHRIELYYQMGGFNESLSRLVDWDLILRYTKFSEPFFLNETLAQYFLSEELNNISYNSNYAESVKKVHKLHYDEIKRIELEEKLKKQDKIIKKKNKEINNLKSITGWIKYKLKNYR